MATKDNLIFTARRLERWLNNNPIDVGARYSTYNEWISNQNVIPNSSQACPYCLCGVPEELFNENENYGQVLVMGCPMCGCGFIFERQEQGNAAREVMRFRFMPRYLQLGVNQSSASWVLHYSMRPHIEPANQHDRLMQQLRETFTMGRTFTSAEKQNTMEFQTTLVDSGVTDPLANADNQIMTHNNTAFIQSRRDVGWKIQCVIARNYNFIITASATKMDEVRRAFDMNMGNTATNVVNDFVSRFSPSNDMLLQMLNSGNTTRNAPVATRRQTARPEDIRTNFTSGGVPNTFNGFPVMTSNNVARGVVYQVGRTLVIHPDSLDQLGIIMRNNGVTVQESSVTNEPATRPTPAPAAEPIRPDTGPARARRNVNF